MAIERHSQSTSPVERQESRALVVGSWQGDVAVVQAQTGTRLWHQRTDRSVASLTQDGERFYLSVGESLSRPKEPQHPTSELERARLRQRLLEEADAPTPLICRRLDDGSLVWTQTDWSLTGALHLAVDGNTVLAGSSVRRLYAEPVPSIYALDTDSGRVLWTLPGDHTSIVWWPIHTGGGRVFVNCSTNQMQVLLVLETRTGRELWRFERGSTPCLSLPSGALGLVSVQHPAGLPARLVLRAEDGTQLSQFWWLSGSLRLFTDVGVAYLASTMPDEAWVAAVDATGGGKELWRAEGVLAHSMALDGDQLYYAGVRYDPHLPPSPSALAEVGSLDVHTGRRLWTWRSPRNTTELLQLWGTRTPVMLIDSAKKSWATIMSVLADPRQRATASLRREMQIGQWRHPYTLHGAINALWLEARNGLVYVGTRLGLFALDGEDGTVKWHGLPDVDLSFVLPALPPR